MTKFAAITAFLTTAYAIFATNEPQLCCIRQGENLTLYNIHLPTEDEQEFKALPEYYVEEKMAFLHSDRLDEPNFSLHSEDLLVSIATTYPIKEEDLSYIDPSNTMIRYNIQVDRMGYDFFNSNQKIRSYADRIIDDLRKLGLV